MLYRSQSYAPSYLKEKDARKSIMNNRLMKSSVLSVDLSIVR